MEKIKGFWTYLLGAVAAIFGLMWYYLTRKNQEINHLNSLVNMVATQKTADLLESHIKDIKLSKDKTKTEVKKIDQVLEQLTDKRKQLALEYKNASEKEIIDYWNKS